MTGYTAYGNGDTECRAGCRLLVAFRTNTLDEIGANEWINLWAVMDNGADTVQVYAQSEITFPVQTLLDDDAGTTTFAFRNGTGDPLTTFLLRTGDVHGAPYYLDDVYMDASGVNLVNPIPEPSSLSLLALGLGGFAIGAFRKLFP